MNAVYGLGAIVSGLVAFVTALVVMAIAAVVEGEPALPYADLLTAAAVGVAVGVSQPVMAAITLWWARRRWRTETMPVRPRPRSRQWASTQDRFDKFTDRARQVLTFAQDEAQRFNHNYIGTEHLLLGLIRVRDCVAARVLVAMGVEQTQVRNLVESVIGRADKPAVGEVGLTPRAKRVIELSIDESRRLGHSYVGTEHLLLGLVREGEGIAAGVLESLGVDLDRTREEVTRALSRGIDEGV